jgi:hypothetical protein
MLSPGLTRVPLAGVADLLTCTVGPTTGVITVLLQRAAAGQVGSPPPITLAVLVTLGRAAAVDVTGITKLTFAAGARPTAIVQVTVWPAAEQLAGMAPVVRLAGTASVTVATAAVRG